MRQTPPTRLSGKSFFCSPAEVFCPVARVWLFPKCHPSVIVLVIVSVIVFVIIFVVVFVFVIVFVNVCVNVFWPSCKCLCPPRCDASVTILWWQCHSCNCIRNLTCISSPTFSVPGTPKLSFLVSNLLFKTQLYLRILKLAPGQFGLWEGLVKVTWETISLGACCQQPFPESQIMSDSFVTANTTSCWRFRHICKCIFVTASDIFPQIGWTVAKVLPSFKDNSH